MAEKVTIIDHLTEEEKVEMRGKAETALQALSEPVRPEQLTIVAALQELEIKPESERLQYYKENLLPLLAKAEPVERAQASKRAARLLDVSMQTILKEIKQISGEDNEEKSQADVLTEIALSNLLFHDDMNEPYTLLEFSNHNQIVKIGRNKDFTRYLAGEYYKQTGNSPANEAIRQAQNVAEAKAVFDGECYRLELRVTEAEGAFWYDLADEKCRAIRITAQGWDVIDKPPILFRRRNNQSAQSEPVGKGDLSRLKSLIYIDDESFSLLQIYLVTALVPAIPHVIPVFHGEKGAAKSTTMQIIRRLIDPANRDLFALPKDQNELALQLFGNYMPAYDNLSGMSQIQSDMLCGAATGGGISKRTLYSDDEDTILKFFCCPMLNGINVAASATDLLDRCLLFELKRIGEENRREISTIFKEFEEARPYILSGLFDALSAAMRLYPSVKLDRLPRMADFARWGYAAAEVLGIGGERFLEIYRQNRDRVNMAAIDENALATAIVAYMDDKDQEDVSATNLLMALNEIAELIKIDIKNRKWPKQANTLTREIKQIKSNLLDVGIDIDIYRGRRGARVTLVKVKKQSSPSSHRHKSSNNAPLKGDDGVTIHDDCDYKIGGVTRNSCKGDFLEGDI